MAFKKIRKGRNRCMSSCQKIIFLEYGIKSISRGFINKKQIESARIVINKTIKKSGKLIIRVYPDYPKTKKPIEVRMGNGKGEIEDYYFRVKPGKIIFELSSSEKMAKKACKLSSFKLPIKVVLEKRNFFQ
ncbi:50S ribosomal protein L16 [Candidatus Vidania fulgoroideorum]